MGTYTFAVMHVSKETYEEIKRKMIEAGYDHVFHSHEDGPVIDMNGIKIQAEKDRIVVMTTETIEDHIVPNSDKELTFEWYIDQCEKLSEENKRLREQLDGHRGAGIFDGDL